jgi:glucose-1-phosphate thymidylyltransferase
MKGIILAGGSGTRLRPMTEVVCKQLLPVFDKPMIYYPLSTLIHAGVDEVLLISSPDESIRFRALLGDGGKFGIRIDYADQEKPEGLPQGILIAEEFIQNENFWFILGDNLFHGPDFGGTLKLLSMNAGKGAAAFAYRVSDVSQYGTVRFPTKKNTAVELIEKPDEHEIGWAIPGLYHFDSSAVERTKSITPSSRGELEIIDLLKSYLLENSLEIRKISRGNAWFDLGTAEDLLLGAQFVHLIQSRQGLLVGSPEEASLNAGKLNANALENLLKISPKSAYFESLKSSRKEFL